MVPEPAHRDGSAVTGRYAIARFNIRTTGRPSHAGWALADGRSAIAAMARKVLEIEAMTTDDCTFSVGVIHAGQWVNWCFVLLRRGSPLHGQAPGRSRSRRRTDAGAFG